MGIYSRFKRDPSGFRELVELLESSPRTSREKMVQAGMQEDPKFTREALKYTYTFEDVLNLSDLEIAELMAAATPRLMGVAIQPFSDEVKNRFIRNSKGPVTAEIRECLENTSSLKEIGGAQLAIIAVLRGLERKGYIKAKKIPPGGMPTD